jgi:hypothetical protein
MLDNDLLTQGYKLTPTKYTPSIGYSRLQALISGQATQRFYDIKRIHLPTYHNRIFKNIKITRHEMEPTENFEVCIGRFSLDTYQGDVLQGFTFGGTTRVSIQNGDLYCDFTSTAPIYTLHASSINTNSLLIDEIVEMLAEKKARLGGSEDELYARLAGCDAYTIFLGCLSSLHNKLASAPSSMHKGNYPKALSQLEHVIQLVCKTDGWNGTTPTLDDLLIKKT